MGLEDHVRETVKQDLTPEGSDQSVFVGITLARLQAKVKGACHGTWRAEIHVKPLLTSTLLRGEWLHLRYGRFIPVKRVPGTHLTGRN